MPENLIDIERRSLMMHRAKLEKLITERQMAYYRAHPDRWLEERFKEPAKSVDWDLWPGYKDHIWDGDKNPLAGAWQALADGFDCGVESATGTGKTFWLARVMFWFLDCFENPTVVTCAPKEDQLKLLLWKEVSRGWQSFQKIQPRASLSSLTIYKDPTHLYYGKSAIAVGFVAGVGANEESATKAHGFHAENMLIIVEETPGVNGAIMKAFGNTSVGTNNRILAVGNPDNETDELHKFCIQAGVKSFRVSAYDHPNIVLKREVIPGAVSQKSINKRAETYGKESPFYLSRVRGIVPKESVDSLFHFRWLMWCADEKNTVVNDYTYNAVGIDVANSMDGDKAATAWGRSNTLEFIDEFRCPNANHLAYNLVYDDMDLEAENITNYNTFKLKDFEISEGWCIGIDSVGVGVATVNTFIDMNIGVVALHGAQTPVGIPEDSEGKPLWVFNNLRSQMYFEAAQDCRQHKIALRISNKKVLEQLTREVMAHTYTTKSGKIVVQSKDDIKKKLGGKSPNLSDAFVYWNHVRKGYYAGGGYAPLGA